MEKKYNIFTVQKTLAERRAKFAYEAARVENAMAKRPINPEPWEERDSKFRKNMIQAVLEKIKLSYQ